MSQRALGLKKAKEEKTKKGKKREKKKKNGRVVLCRRSNVVNSTMTYRPHFAPAFELWKNRAETLAPGGLRVFFMGVDTHTLLFLAHVPLEISLG